MAVYSIAKPLQRLLRIKPGPRWIVSCYLKLEPRDRTGGKYLIKLKNRIREVSQTLPALGLSRKEIAAVEADLARVQAELRRPDSLPKTNGVAVFACRGLKLLETVPLPRVHRSRLLVDRTPLVRELVALEDEVGRLFTVVLDRARARVFEISAFSAREIADIASPATRGGRFHSDRHSAPGFGEHSYHNRIRHERQRHLDLVAQRLFELDREGACRGIVLSGLGDAEALRPFLHPYLMRKVLGTVRLNPKTTSEAEVLDATLTVRETYEHRLERHAVAEMLLAQGSGWSVNGIAPTLRALGEGQVRTLLVRGDASVPGFRCADQGRLALAAHECRGGEAVPVSDVIDDAIEEALRQRIGLEVVFEPDAAETIDGLAAMLRFK